MDSFDLLRLYRAVDLFSGGGSLIMLPHAFTPCCPAVYVTKYLTPDRRLVRRLQCAARGQMGESDPTLISHWTLAKERASHLLQLV